MIKRGLRSIASKLRRYLSEDAPVPPEVPVDNTYGWLNYIFSTVLRSDVKTRRKPQYLWGMAQAAALGTALRPGLLTTGGPLFVTSTPYAKRGELWDNYRRHWGQDDDPVLVWKASTLEMHPDVPQEDIAEAYLVDAEAAAAEYGGEFRSDLDSFISPELLAKLVVPGRYELPPMPGVEYHAFVDPSGGTQSSYTVAVAHQDRATGASSSASRMSWQASSSR